MASPRNDTLPIRSEEDVVRVRQAVRQRAGEMGFSLVDQTKVVTAASELARNTLIHGRGGEAQLEVVESNGRRGLRLAFKDEGPGIADVALAMKDGYTTGSGLGLGLSGSKRLLPDFQLETEPGKGTCVTVTKWR